MVYQCIRKAQTNEDPIAIVMSSMCTWWNVVRNQESMLTYSCDGSFQAALAIPGLIDTINEYYHPLRRSNGPSPSIHLTTEEAKEEARAFASLFRLEDGK